MILENVDEPTSHQTEFLLKSIAERLSGREDCKKVPFRVIIDHNGVRMNPIIMVYRNRYNRKETDKMDIVSFVHQYKMQSAKLTGFVFGIYEYQLSPDGRRRKWRKIDEG